MLLNLIAGHDERDTTSAEMPKKDYTKALKNDVKGLKIGVPKEFYGEGQQWFNMKRLKKDIQISESNVLDGRLDKNYKMLIPNDEDLRDNYE